MCIRRLANMCMNIRLTVKVKAFHLPLRGEARYFLLLVQKKVPKENDPRRLADEQIMYLFIGSLRASFQTGATQTRAVLRTESRSNSACFNPVCHSVLGCV